MLSLWSIGVGQEAKQPGRDKYFSVDHLATNGFPLTYASCLTGLRLMRLLRWICAGKDDRYVLLPLRSTICPWIISNFPSPHPVLPLNCPLRHLICFSIVSRSHYHTIGASGNLHWTMVYLSQCITELIASNLDFCSHKCFIGLDHSKHKNVSGVAGLQRQI